MIDGVRVTHLGQRFTVVNFDGTLYKGRVVSIDKKFDTCLLSVENVFVRPRALRVAIAGPRRGELCYNMAAPHGIISPRMVLTFSGYFSGFSPEGYGIYTIPTKPGSSGSPITNINNELIGLIFAGYRSMENVGVASPLTAIKVFLKKSISKAEMGAWNSLNKGGDKTSVTVVKRLEKLQHKLDEYFNIPAVNGLER